MPDALLVIKPEAQDGKFSVVYSNLKARKVFNFGALNPEETVLNTLLEEYIFYNSKKEALLNSL